MSPQPEDGRRARRDRNRDAVVDAYLELVRGGEIHPSVADVAQRSGVSHRSVFRYFADKDELARTAIDRQLEFVRSLPTLEVGADIELAERIDVFADRCAATHDAVGAVGRLSRSMAVHRPIIAEQLDRSRRAIRKQIRRTFAKELTVLDDATAVEIVAAIAAACSFETYELLRSSEGLSRPRAVRTMARTIGGLLSH